MAALIDTELMGGTMENENLSSTDENNTIVDGGNTDNQEQAASSGAEDATLSGYQAIIESQNKTIDALMAQTQALQEQVKVNSAQWERAIRQGAAITTDGSANAPHTQQSSSLSESYVPLKDMDYRISKKDLM